MPINAIIIRTSWLYSEYGNNFVSTMLRLGKERDELSVISDQIGSPTYATDLANAILEIIKNKEFSESDQTTQVYHYSNEGKVSWYEFAKEIFKIAKIDCKVSPITTQQYPTPTKRPGNTVMRQDKISHKFGVKTYNWSAPLRMILEQQRK
jgi:dTDP-4-dehydrorhamnose reductase|tara:strand:+ start:193 stop:645 length:453 start_codon:yes stop_codon:yes gene_type:complete